MGSEKRKFSSENLLQSDEKKKRRKNGSYVLKKNVVNISMEQTQPNITSETLIFDEDMIWMTVVFDGTNDRTSYKMLDFLEFVLDLLEILNWTHVQLLQQLEGPSEGTLRNRMAISFGNAVYLGMCKKDLTPETAEIFVNLWFMYNRGLIDMDELRQTGKRIEDLREKQEGFCQVRGLNETPPVLHPRKGYPQKRREFFFLVLYDYHKYLAVLNVNDKVNGTSIPDGNITNDNDNYDDDDNDDNDKNYEEDGFKNWELENFMREFCPRERFSCFSTVINLDKEEDEDEEKERETEEDLKQRSKKVIEIVLNRPPGTFGISMFHLLSPNFWKSHSLLFSKFRREFVLFIRSRMESSRLLSHIPKNYDRISDKDIRKIIDKTDVPALKECARRLLYTWKERRADLGDGIFWKTNGFKFSQQPFLNVCTIDKDDLKRRLREFVSEKEYDAMDEEMAFLMSKKLADFSVISHKGLLIKQDGSTVEGNTTKFEFYAKLKNNTHSLAELLNRVSNYKHQNQLLRDIFKRLLHYEDVEWPKYGPLNQSLRLSTSDNTFDWYVRMIDIVVTLCDVLMGRHIPNVVITLFLLFFNSITTQHRLHMSCMGSYGAGKSFLFKSMRLLFDRNDSESNESHQIASDVRVSTTISMTKAPEVEYSGTFGVQFMDEFPRSIESQKIDFLKSIMEEGNFISTLTKDGKEHKVRTVKNQSYVICSNFRIDAGLSDRMINFFFDRLKDVITPDKPFEKMHRNIEESGLGKFVDMSTSLVAFHDLCRYIDFEDFAESKSENLEIEEKMNTITKIIKQTKCPFATDARHLRSVRLLAAGIAALRGSIVMLRNNTECEGEVKEGEVGFSNKCFVKNFRECRNYFKTTGFDLLLATSLAPNSEEIRVMEGARLLLDGVNPFQEWKNDGENSERDFPFFQLAGTNFSSVAEQNPNNLDVIEVMSTISALSKMRKYRDRQDVFFTSLQRDKNKKRFYISQGFAGTLFTETETEIGDQILSMMRQNFNNSEILDDGLVFISNMTRKFKRYMKFLSFVKDEEERTMVTELNDHSWYLDIGFQAFPLRIVREHIFTKLGLEYTFSHEEGLMRITLKKEYENYKMLLLCFNYMCNVKTASWLHFCDEESEECSYESLTGETCAVAAKRFDEKETALLLSEETISGSNYAKYLEEEHTATADEYLCQKDGETFIFNKSTLFATVKATELDCNLRRNMERLFARCVQKGILGKDRCGLFFNTAINGKTEDKLSIINIGTDERESKNVSSSSPRYFHFDIPKNKLVYLKDIKKWHSL